MNTPKPQSKPFLTPELKDKLVCVFVVTLLTIGILECVAWVFDANYSFRDKLLKTLQVVEPLSQPVPGRLPDPADKNTLMIRKKVFHEKTTNTQEYVLGGKVIPHANRDTRTERLTSQQAFLSPRKRVFILGGSAAFGYPYPFEKTFAKLLEDEISGYGYTVLNASLPGAASGHLTAVAKTIVDDFAPEVIILFCGNNEWIQWVPDIQPLIKPENINLMRHLSRSRILATLLYFRIQKLASSQDYYRQTEPDSFRMHNELTGFYYALAHPYERYGPFNAQKWLETKTDFLNNFEKNLLFMTRYAQNNGVKVILMTIPFRYQLSVAWKHPQPEAFKPATRMQVRKNIKEAVWNIEQEHWTQALSLIRTSLEMDPYPPLLHYLKGFILERLEKFPDAKEAYVQARENMIGNQGAILNINNTIRTISLLTEAVLIDLAAMFEEGESLLGGHFNENLIDDDCHPNPIGQKIIAQSLASILTNSSWESK